MLSWLPEETGYPVSSFAESLLLNLVARYVKW